MSTSQDDAGGNAARRRATAGLAQAGVFILYEDPHLVALSKPAGLASQGGSGILAHVVSLTEAYRQEAENKPGRAFVGPVNRLDRNVSGVMVIAKRSKAARRLAAAFRERSTDVEKTYLGWVDGHLDPPRGPLVDRLRRDNRVTRRAGEGDVDAKVARLTYVVEGKGPSASRLRVTLETGVTHQIRAQLALAGHPLLGDVKYGGAARKRVALHAWRLAFPHPVSGEILTVTAPPPEYLRDLDRALAIRPPL